MNSQVLMSNQPKFDLEERTAVFGEKVIACMKRLPKNDITRPLIIQLVRAATSVGANYCEADDAVGKKDFKNKIGISKKEARECKHFLRMINGAAPGFEIEINGLLQEAKELHLIFNAIFSKV